MNRFGPEWVAFCAAHRAAGKTMKDAVVFADNDILELITIRIPLNSTFSEQRSTSRNKRIFKVVGYDKNFKVKIEDEEGEGWFENSSTLLNNDLWFFLSAGYS